MFNGSLSDCEEDAVLPPAFGRFPAIVDSELTGDLQKIAGTGKEDEEKPII